MHYTENMQNSKDKSWKLARLSWKKRLAVVLAIGLGVWSILTSDWGEAGKLQALEPKNAPVIAFLDPQGNTHHLSDYQSKITILNFWATWCSPCKKEMPLLDTLAKERDLNIIVIASESDAKLAERFFTEHGIQNLTPFYDKNNIAFDAYRVSTLPMAFVINPQGKLVARAVGMVDWPNEPLLKRLRAELKKESML